MFIIDDIVNAIGAHAAAQAQEKSAREAMALQREMWETQRADQMPWMEAGKTSLASLLSMRGGPQQLDPANFANNPAYQFRLAEGQKALERSAAARGGLNSGGLMKGLARYGQGLASEEYGNEWNRNQMGFSNQWNRLAGLAGLGQGSAQSVGGMGSHYADAMSNLYGAQGNAQASGVLGLTGGAAGAVRSIGNFATMGMMGGGNPGMGGGMGASTGYIPTQGFNIPQLGYRG